MATVTHIFCQTGRPQRFSVISAKPADRPGIQGRWLSRGESYPLTPRPGSIPGLFLEECYGGTFEGSIEVWHFDVAGTIDDHFETTRRSDDRVVEKYRRPRCRGVPTPRSDDRVVCRGVPQRSCESVSRVTYDKVRVGP